MFGNTIKINGKDYVLKFDFNALIEMKGNGLDVMKLGDELDLEEIRLMFYYGLKKYHGKEVIEVKHAGNLMSDYVDCGGSFESLAKIVGEALSSSMGIKTSNEATQEGK